MNAGNMDKPSEGTRTSGTGKAKVSIIIPAYNAEKTIERCLASALGQTLSEIEVVLVDDGSTDRTPELAEGFNDPRLVLVRQANTGQSLARRNGLARAKGEYVAFLDADDWLEPDMLKTMLAEAGGNSADVVCCSYYEHWGKHEQAVHIASEERTVVHGSEEMERLLHLFQGGIKPYLWNKLYRKCLFDGVDFPEEKIVGEDYCVLAQLLETADILVCLQAAFYHYIHDPGSMTLSGYTPAYRASWTMYEKYTGMLGQRYPRHRDIFDGFFHTESLAMITAMIKANTYDEELLEKVLRFNRTHLGTYLRTEGIPLSMRVSAVVIRIDHRLFAAAYRMAKAMSARRNGF